MLLSSLNKIANYTETDITKGSEALKNRRKLLNWQSAITSRIQSACQRIFIKGSGDFTEYFDTIYRQTSFFPRAIPITSITSVTADSLGQFTNQTSYVITPDMYHVGIDASSLVLIFPLVEARRGLQLIYNGGFASDAVQSVFNVTGVTGTPTAAQYVTNQFGSAAGIIRAYNSSAGTLIIENLYGVFSVGDILAFATTEEALFEKTGSSFLNSIAATISAIASQSLAESNPDLERAVECETRYMVTHQKDFENVSSMNDQTQRRQMTQFQRPYDFQPETVALLRPYVRHYL